VKITIPLNSLAGDIAMPYYIENTGKLRPAQLPKVDNNRKIL
jgi:hypothetical protein